MDKEPDLLKMVKKNSEPTELTPMQKLQAMAHKYYLCGVTWHPKTGDYYTSARADLELYQIVEANETVVRTKYCDPSRGNTISDWPTETFLKDFGESRVWVPNFILNIK